MTFLTKLGNRLGILNPHPDLDRLSEFVEDNPSHLWIEPTNRCNIRCRHCQHGKAIFGQDMTEETFQSILAAGLLDHARQNKSRIALFGQAGPEYLDVLRQVSAQVIEKNEETRNVLVYFDFAASSSPLLLVSPRPVSVQFTQPLR